MSIEPEEHDYIGQVIAEDAAKRVPRRLSDDPAVRLAECRRGMAEQVRKASVACDAGLPMLPVVFDESAEREKAYDAWDGLGDWGDFRDGWLACARQKAGESK